MQRFTSITCLCVSTLVGACSGGGDDPSTSNDAAVGAGGSDAGGSDAGLSDAGRSDAGLSDAGPSDAGPSDASSAADAADDAAATDAGSNQDAATTDAGFRTGCADKPYQLCEDFESASTGALPAGWTAVSGGGSGAIVVANDQPHSGSKSLKSALAASGQPRAARSLSGLGTLANKHWGRVFYKVATPTPLPPSLDSPPQSVIHGTLLGLQGSTEARVVDTVLDGQGKHQFLYNLPDDECCTDSAYDYTFDGKWHCAEWYVDAADQRFRFFYDSKEVASLAFAYGADRRAQIGDFEAVVLGMINYQTAKQPYFQAWLDDLALDDERIGCE